MNCDHREENDEDSVVSERCWEEAYRGDSRKWLLRDGSSKTLGQPVCSAMKESFGYPQHDERPFKGIRRQILEQKLLEEVAQEIIEENKKEPSVEEYCTHYDETFVYPGFDHKKIEKDTSLYLKYPLYSSEATSFWKFKMDKRIPGQTSLAGLTRSVDIQKPFKRNSEFSKPITEVLDNSFL